MRAVWKYPVSLTDNFELRMPEDAKILFVAVQDGAPYCWALVDPYRALSRTRQFILRGTGHEIDTPCEHVGSFMLHDGALVFHLFEVV